MNKVQKNNFPFSEYFFHTLNTSVYSSSYKIFIISICIVYIEFLSEKNHSVCLKYVMLLLNISVCVDPYKMLHLSCLYVIAVNTFIEHPHYFLCTKHIRATVLNDKYWSAKYKINHVPQYASIGLLVCNTSWTLDRWRRRQCVPPKFWCLSKSPHGITRHFHCREKLKSYTVPQYG